MPGHFRPAIAPVCGVAEMDAIYFQFVDHAPAPARANAGIMIANNPDPVEFASEPLQLRRCGPVQSLFAGAVVKIVAKAPDCLRAILPDQPRNFIKRRLAIIRRQHLTVFCIAGCLFQMQVGDQQRTVGRPEQRRLAGRDKFGIGKVQRRDHENIPCTNAVVLTSALRSAKRPAMIAVAALYHFAPIAEPASLRESLLALCNSSGVKGTLLLAQEGINGTIAGSREALNAVLTHIRGWEGFPSLEVKFSNATAMPFGRMKVKVKREIVTMGIEGIDAQSDAGAYVAASEWNALIADPDTILIDTRNDFEVQEGSFPGAINPETASFRQFPNWFDAQSQQWQGKKIAMFCTGGIRCEKATAYAKARGFADVYHLKGGILKYLEDVPAAESVWRGDCFVFDEREALGLGLELKKP